MGSTTNRQQEQLPSSHCSNVVQTRKEKKITSSLRTTGLHTKDWTESSKEKHELGEIEPTGKDVWTVLREPAHNSSP